MTGLDNVKSGKLILKGISFCYLSNLVKRS